ncbi:hypothetical protein G6F55_006853 [Rhizopus delemar]|nr:hypothetical protein G6F55_006853 [Rhizopus delemar]KAG1536536.1 hypothetical protein G6F51_010915 [Rhizopus arrhizus]KAG1522712.1 hypothetical protein G6F52_005628 [Rhizopus delemar]KAG1554461.1 hypothetical protein G6F49_007997 [Rhizopus delemar]KAG1564759.1 hypothetical protein G6F50_010715 [Rhizopus delemar]
MSTTKMKQYFYRIARQKYIIVKKYLKTITKTQAVEEETATIENESTLIENEIDCKYTKENDDDDLVKIFKDLDPNKRWRLSTGKYVENELFIFGLQCQEDHPSKSLIINPGDLSYVEYGVFTKEELDEILNFEEKKLSLPPLHVVKHMDKYNLKTAADIRSALKKNHTFEDNPDKDIDWINYTVYGLLREYESGNMKKHHSEIWYQTHIWRMIEICFDKFEDLEAAIGESMSITSQKRKNQKRTISGMMPMVRKSMGHKCDSVFRTYQVKHSKGLEFGATEAKGNYDNSSDHLKDALYKLPRTLKDMLDDLIETKPELRGSLQTVGFIHSGLANTMLQVDRPTEYVTRVTRHKTIEISHSIENFGATILLSMLSAWICAEIVNQVFQLFTSSSEEAGEKEFSWMRNYLEKQKVLPMPATSRSTETRSRKKTKITN